MITLFEGPGFQYRRNVYRHGRRQDREERTGNYALPSHFPANIQEMSGGSHDGGFCADLVEQIKPELALRSLQSVVALIIRGDSRLDGCQGYRFEANGFMQRRDLRDPRKVATKAARRLAIRAFAAFQKRPDFRSIFDPLGKIINQISQNTEAADKSRIDEPIFS